MDDSMVAPMVRVYGICHVAVLTLTHGYNTVRGHRTGSNNSGVEDYLWRKTHTVLVPDKTEDNTQNN